MENKYQLENKNKYEKIKGKQKEKITCECGALVSSCNLKRHKKSMKHIKLTECIILD
tara:strand:+ start:1141 stop:1311 length:171 start_codon:yes stop_codon:yes gene_type:complete